VLSALGADSPAGFMVPPDTKRSDIVVWYYGEMSGLNLVSLSLCVCVCVYACKMDLRLRGAGEIGAVACVIDSSAF
jgi:hypothetical protein